MKQVARLFLLWLAYHLAKGDEPPAFRVVCTASAPHHLLPDENYHLLDKICTDMIYRISDWHTFSKDPKTAIGFRHRHPNVRLYLSIQDINLMAIQDPTDLIQHLKEGHFFGLDIVASRSVEVSRLKRILDSYRSLLSDNYLGLTVTIDNQVDVNAFVKEDIANLVDNILYIRRSSSYQGSSNIADLLPPSKLVMGLPSTDFSRPPSSDPADIPGSLAELCPELDEWKPKIMDQDQVIWKHPTKSWTFLMRTSQSVEEEVEELQRTGVSGVLLHDVTFGPEPHPICSNHRALFIQAVQQATYGPEPQEYNDRIKRAANNNGGRSGKILVFSQSKEEVRVKQRYGVLDDESGMITGQVYNIVLGYDGSGKIYDIYEQMPRQLNTTSILQTIHEYYIDQIISGKRGSFGAQLPPPSIVVYPDASGANPIRITWVRMNGPAERLAVRKTRKPRVVSSTTTKTPPTTTTTTTTKPKQKTTTQKLCGDDVRCHLPTGLMDVMGRPRVTKATPKPTKPRLTTVKPAIPLNPNARSAAIRRYSIGVSSSASIVTTLKSTLEESNV